MRPLRAASVPLLFVSLFVLSGCLAYGADAIYRPGPDRGRAVSSRQIERDVRTYVRHLDRHLRLDRRQERRIESLLLDRTHHLIRNTRGEYRYEVYPFPREFGRHQNRTVRRWWTNADRDVERVLDRKQRNEFRKMKRDFERSDRRDSRYEPRRPTPRRY